MEFTVSIPKDGEVDTVKLDPPEELVELMAEALIDDFKGVN